MRLKRLIAFILTLFCLFIAEDADAQRKNKYQKRKTKNRQISHYRGGRIGASRFAPYSYVGVSANAMNYFGDLAPASGALSTDVTFTRPGFGIFYGRKFHHSMSYRAAFNYGRLKGDDITADPNSEADAPRYYRNLSFRNDIKELSATLQFDLIPNYGGPQSRMLINGYAFVGVAVFHHEPKGLVPDLEYQTDFNNPQPAPQAGEWVKLRPLGTEGQNFGEGKKYSPFQLAIPVGIGGEAFLTSNLSVGIEFGVRKLFFDYIDDVSGSYADLDKFSDPLGRIMSDRSLEAKAVWQGQARDVPLSHVSNYNGFDRSGYLGSGMSVDAAGNPTQRGNPESKDVYFMTQIKVIYVLNNSRKAKHR
jgi:hypothetical protein